MERLKCCLQKLCVRLLAILRKTHGTCCTLYSTFPQRSHARYRASVLGDDLQSHGFDTNCERWLPGGPGSVESPSVQHQIDIIDTQCWPLSRTLDLQLRRRNWWPTQFARDVDENANQERCPNNSRWSLETASDDEQFTTHDWRSWNMR